jgi:hypothetical protein
MRENTFRAFVKQALAMQMSDEDTPPGYLETRVAVMRKLGMPQVSGQVKPIPPAQIKPAPPALPSTTPPPPKTIPDSLSGSSSMKMASAAAELSGLGMLAVPSIQELRGKEQNEKSKAKWEVAGLGTLAAPYVHEMAKKRSTNYAGLASRVGKAFGRK